MFRYLATAAGRLSLIFAVLMTGVCSPGSIFDDIVQGRSLLTGLSISPTAVTFALVDGQRLTAFGHYENGDRRDLSSQVTWASSEPSIGFVQSGGEFKAINVGGTVIKASIEGFQASANVSIAKNSGTIYVDVNYELGFNDGSMERPFQSIRQAVQVAEAKGSAEVLVAKGSYTEDAIIVSRSLNLMGGYNTSNSEDPNAGNWETDVQLGLSDTVDPADTVIQASEGIGLKLEGDVSEDTTVSGFTINGSNITGTTVSQAVYINGVSPTLENLVIDGGQATSVTAGIALQNSSGIIRNSTINGGESGGSSTAISFTASHPQITGNSIDGGRSETYSYGLNMSGSNPTVSENDMIMGGISNGSSAAVALSTSHPTLDDNEIYGGKAAAYSYGITMVSSNPNITDNEITAALPAGHSEGTGGAGNNLAVLAQTSSLPVIDGNTIDAVDADEDSYNLRFESSSDGTVKNNDINDKAGNGILAQSASPAIENNTFTADDNDGVCIRGEATSLSASGNTIIGDVQLALNSISAVIDANPTLNGGISISGNSTGIVVSNHFEAAANSYGKTTTKAITGNINISGSSTATFSNNASGRFSITEGSFVTIEDSYVGSGNGIAIKVNDSGADIYRNLISATGTNSSHQAISFEDCGQASDVYNNVIFRQADDVQLYGIEVVNQTNWLYIFQNLIVMNEMNATDTSRAVRIESYDTIYRTRLTNNIVYYVETGPSNRAFIDAVSGDDMNTIKGNYAINHDIFAQVDAGDRTADQINDASGGDDWFNNDGTSITTNWVDSSCLVSGSISIIDCDFNINGTSSSFRQGGAPLTQPNALIDINGNCRDGATNPGVGPFEYSGDVVPCS